MTVNEVIETMDNIEEIRFKISNGNNLCRGELNDIDSYLESYSIILGKLGVKGV